MKTVVGGAPLLGWLAVIEMTSPASKAMFWKLTDVVSWVVKALTVSQPVDAAPACCGPPELNRLIKTTTAPIVSAQRTTLDHCNVNRTPPTIAHSLPGNCQVNSIVRGT